MDILFTLLFKKEKLLQQEIVQNVMLYLQHHRCDFMNPISPVKPCPNCGNYSMIETRKFEYVNEIPKRMHIERKCDKCGYTITEPTEDSIDLSDVEL